jgi:hypothetical protein
MDGMTEQGELFAVLEQKAKRKSLLHEWLEAHQRHGVLMPPVWVGHVLAVSRQRVDELIQKRQLASIVVRGRRFVPVAAIDAYLAEERKNGRPCKEPSLRESMKFGLAEAVGK